VETEIAALVWAHCNNEAEIRKLLDSDLCTNAKKTISLMTLVRGLDVACWRTKWINSIDKADEKISFYHSELEEDWNKIRILKEFV
jgi:hypothetical protein